MAVDFANLLSVNLDTVEKPKPWPVGTYHGVLLKYEAKSSKEKETPMIEFTVQVQTPGDDVDPESLVGVDLTKRPFRKNYFLTADASWRLKALLSSLGISTTGRTFNETLPETVGEPIMISVIQKPNKDGTDFYNDIGDLVGTKG